MNTHKKLSGRRNQKERIYDGLKKGLSWAGGAVAPPAIFLETLAKYKKICYNKIKKAQEMFFIVDCIQKQYI